MPCRGLYDVCLPMGLQCSVCGEWARSASSYGKFCSRFKKINNTERERNLRHMFQFVNSKIYRT